MAIDYARDIVNFMCVMCPVEGDHGPRAVMPPFLRQWLSTAFPLPDGHPAARNVLDARSKKQGKSSTAAVVALYMATREPGAEVVIAASDKDQAKDRVLRACKFAVERGPLAAHARVFRDVIEVDNGSLITAIPNDWRSAAGGNYACIIFDELHSYTLEAQRRLFDELVIPPTKPHGVRWIASYAGYLGESVLLKEIWDKALSGDRLADDLPIYHSAESSLLAFIDTGQESWRMPWTTSTAGRRYMAEVEATERPNTFRRLYLNEWVSSESQFVSPEQWAACYSDDVHPIADGDKRVMVLGADASTSRDLTALVGCVHNADMQTVDVAYCRVWRPHKGTVDLSATIGAEVRRLHGAGLVTCVEYDPYQLHSLATDLQREGIRMVAFPQNAQRVIADQALYDAIVGRTLRHYGDPTLAEHIKNAVAAESERGFRLAKERTSRKIDAAVALSMAHHGARERRGTAAPAGMMAQIAQATWQPSRYAVLRGAGDPQRSGLRREMKREQNRLSRARRMR